MRNLPLPARFYLLALWAATLLIAVATTAWLQPVLVQPWLFAAATAAVLVAQRAAVSSELQHGHRLSFTVHEAFCMLFVPTLGLIGAWAFALSTVLVGFWERRPWERVLFNSASLFCTYSCAFAAYMLLQPPDTIPFSGFQGVLTFFGVTLVYYLSNTLLVTSMIALATAQPVLRIYRAHFRQVSWVQLLTFVIGASMAALWFVEPWLVLYGLCTLLIAQRAFATIVALHSETLRRQALAEERARLAEALQQRQAELDRSARLTALGTFSAGIAHEFNNVLTLVSGHAQVGQLLDSPEAKNEALATIGRFAQRATSITGSLLAFARQRPPELRLASLQIVIDDTLSTFVHELTREKITLHAAIDELPPLLCDPGQLGQVLLNLLANARDALREQGGGTIRLGLARVSDQAVLSVADDGPGIPQQVLDQLFQPFLTTKPKGNGLGMAICQSIVQAHQGTIDVQSAPNVGTTITVHLPLAATSQAQAQPSDSEPPSQQTQQTEQAVAAHP
jgi:signal transduction histidine kinase